MQWWATLTPADYVILALLLLAFLQGWSRGLFSQVLRIGAFIATIVVAGRYGGLVRQTLNRHFHLQEHLKAFLATRLPLPSGVNPPEGAVPQAPPAEVVNGLSLPQSYKDTLIQRIMEWYQGQPAAAVDELLLDQLAEGLASVIAYLLAALITGIILGIVASLISPALENDALLNTANRLAGGIVCGLEVAIVISLVAALAAPALSLSGLPWLQEQLDGAVTTPYFLDLFAWMKAVIFGKGTEQFFVT